MSPTPPPRLVAAAAAAEQMATVHVGEATRRRATATAARYDRWAQANGQPPVPAADPRSVTRWLHAHVDLWGHGTMTVYVDDVRRAQVAAGGTDPTQGMVRDYLAAIARTKGRRTLPRVVALDLADIAAAADRDLHSEQPGGRLLELRGQATVLLARALQVPLSRLVAVEADSVALTAAGLHLVLPPAPLHGPPRPAPRPEPMLLTRAGTALDPVPVVAELLDLLPSGTTRLLGFGLGRTGAGTRPVPAATDARTPQLAARIRTQLAGAAHRAGLPPAALGPDGTGTGLSEADTGWLLAHLNPSLTRQLRDLTYGLLGAATASRHAGLADLRLSDLTRTDNGWEITFGKEKNNVEGRPDLARVRPIDHEPDESGQCPAWCPACALDRWLLFMRRCWGIRDGLLLPALRANHGPSGRLDDWYATLILRRLTSRDDLSTRSMRAGTITALRSEGHDLAAIAEVSGHRSLHQLTRYLRLADPHAGQYHPPL